MRKTAEEWAAFDEVAREFYADGTENVLEIPTQMYERQASNGVVVHLGRDLQNWMRGPGTVPKGMPAATKKFLEECGAIGSLARAIVPSRQRKGAAEWAAFDEVARKYYADAGKKMSELPSTKFEAQASNGIMVHLGRDLAHWRREGADVPKSMPADTRKFLRECGAIGSSAKAMAKSGPKKKSDNEWRAFAQALEDFYADSKKRLVAVPPTRHIFEAGSTTVHLGRDLKDFRRRGVPKGCPEYVRALLEEYGAVGAWGKAVAASQATHRPADTGGGGGSSAQFSDGAGVVPGQYRAQAPGGMGYEPGCGGQYGGAGWESVPQAVMGSVQPSAGGVYSYAGYAALQEDYQVGAYSGGYEGQDPGRMGHVQYAGTDFETFQPFDANAAHLTTAAGPAPGGGYDNSGNPPPIAYSRAPDNRRSPRA
ncbi:hypothetical protein [Micromonospora sp. NPDC005979]|uniref:hypothetical protein n=1 Tax=Micromonospora sp. NPDC005979 TaxID=3156726 RepID=UPI0033B03E3D